MRARNPQASEKSKIQYSPEKNIRVKDIANYTNPPSKRGTPFYTSNLRM